MNVGSSMRNPIPWRNPGRVGASAGPGSPGMSICDGGSSHRTPGLDGHVIREGAAIRLSDAAVAHGFAAGGPDRLGSSQR